MSQWIKVSDRLPDDNRWVIVYYENGTQITPHWCNRVRNKWFAQDRGGAVIDKVLGWMDYPSSPQE